MLFRYSLQALQALAASIDLSGLSMSDCVNRLKTHSYAASEVGHQRARTYQKCHLFLHCMLLVVE